MSKIKVAHILHCVGGVDVYLRLILENINPEKIESIVVHGKNDTQNIFYDQIHFKLMDTAGLRNNSNDEIEKEGIKRTHNLVKNAFYKILVINPYEWDQKAVPIGEMEFDSLVITHADVADFTEVFSKIKNRLPKYNELFVVSLKNTTNEITFYGPIGPGAKYGPIGPQELSKKSGPIGPKTKSGPIGPQNLILNQIVFKFQEVTADEPILIQRHAAVIKLLKNNLDDFSQLLSKESDVGIISNEINMIGHNIHELIGIVTPDEVLNSIFKNFCIGK